MTKVLALALFAIFSTSSIACSPGNLYFDPQFEAGQSRLSSEEVRRLADWRVDQRKRYPNGGEIHVEVLANKGAGVPRNLADARLASLLDLLKNLGIAKVDLDSSAVADRHIDPAHLRRADSRPKVLQYINTASLSMNPRCPHPCCPGPEPMEKK